MSGSLRWTLAVSSVLLQAPSAAGAPGVTEPRNTAAPACIVGDTLLECGLPSIYGYTSLPLGATSSRFTHYYFSSAAGGAYPLGLDSNACVSSEAPCR